MAFVNFFKNLFISPISDLKVTDILVIIGLTFLAIELVKFLASAGKRAARRIFRKRVKEEMHRHKKSDVVCHNCGMPLSRCTCQNNKMLTLNKRYANWKKEETDIKRSVKLSEKLKRLQSKSGNQE